jgi:predicted DNA-binding transcriptional regulator AlpA
MNSSSETVLTADHSAGSLRNESMETQIALGLRKPPQRVEQIEPLLTADEVAKRLNVSTDWVWDHSSRRKPLLPVIRMGDGTLRYRRSGIEAFVDEQERRSALRRRHG